MIVTITVNPSLDRTVEQINACGVLLPTGVKYQR